MDFTAGLKSCSTKTKFDNLFKTTNAFKKKEEMLLKKEERKEEQKLYNFICGCVVLRTILPVTKELNYLPFDTQHRLNTLTTELQSVCGSNAEGYLVAE